MKAQDHGRVREGSTPPLSFTESGSGGKGRVLRACLWAGVFKGRGISERAGTHTPAFGQNSRLAWIAREPGEIARCCDCRQATCPLGAHFLIWKTRRADLIPKFTSSWSHLESTHSFTGWAQDVTSSGAYVTEFL